jgi:hypothetical protein
VQFLAHEDTALKAYHQTRSRYLAGLPPRRAFNQIGEALPTVIVDGTVAGTWSWNTRTATISTDLVPGRTTAAIRTQVRAGAAVLTEKLRSAWAPRLPSARSPSQIPPLPSQPADSATRGTAGC